MSQGDRIETKPPRPPTDRWSAVRWACAAVLPGLVCGVGVMVAHRAPWSMPAVQLIAGALGVVLVASLGPWMRRGMRRYPVRLVVGLVALLGVTLFGEGVEGVLRWVVLGPARLHVSALLGPAILACVVCAWRSSRVWEVAALVALVQCIHIAQPDAGQATAVAAGVVVMAVRSGAASWARVGVGLVACCGAALAWMRPDPLDGVALVEDMLQRAFALGVPVGIGATVALSALCGVPLWWSRRHRADTETLGAGAHYAEAMAAYWAGAIAAVCFGAFPTPVLGFGASPVLGALIGFGLVLSAQEDAGQEHTDGLRVDDSGGA